MLRLPAIANGATWVLYADHADPEIAYALPDVPRLRRAPDDTALLSLLKIRDISGASGGLLAVQTDLALTPEEKAVAVAAYKSATGVGPRLADPLWLAGTASLTVPGPQVAGIDTQPALSGTAAASFECAVAADAAAVLAASLGPGPGLLQVRYGMRALAMLPPCRVHVYLRMGPLAAVWDRVGQSAPAQRRDVLGQAGAAGVDVDDDAGSLDHSLRDQLVGWGWDWLDALIAARTPPSGDPPEGADVEQVMIGSNGLPWPISPAGTLPGLSAADGQWLLEMDLSAPVFPLLQVTTRANALFEADRIAAVTAHLSYGEHRHDAVLTSSQSADELRLVVEPALGPRYQVAPVVSFADSSRTLELAPFASTARDLLITVVDVGWLRVTITSAEVDWALVSQVGVDVRYGDEAAGVPTVQDSLLLDAGHPSLRYQRPIFAARNHPYDVRVRWSLGDGKVIQGDWVTGSGAVFEVGRPWPDILHVRFRAPGAFADIAAITVDATLDLDAAAPRVSTFDLDERHTEAVWTAGLPAGTLPAFRYRVSMSRRDGTSRTQDWVPGTGSGTVPVGPVLANRFELTVAADLLDFAAVRLAKVTLDHLGPSLAHDEIAFTPTSARSVTWTVPLVEGEDPSYTWSAVYWTADQPPRSIAATSSREPTLVLPWP
jgi:hypothetical protein